MPYATARANRRRRCTTCATLLDLWDATSDEVEPRAPVWPADDYGRPHPRGHMCTWCAGDMDYNDL
jgi:hypothetical protein